MAKVENILLDEEHVVAGDDADAPVGGVVGDHDHDPVDGGEHDHGDGENHDHDHSGDHGHDEYGEPNLEKAMKFHLAPDHLIGHVQDAEYFEWFGFSEDESGHVHKNKIKIPQVSPFTADKPFLGENGLIPIAGVNPKNEFFGPATFQPTKFIVLELLGALIVCAVLIPYARRVRGGAVPKGRFWNAIDAMVLFIRDEVAVPSIGSSDAKRFLPFVWSVFFFVLVLNLIGMVPGLGAATGSISVTAAIALAVFGVVILTGVKKMGVVGFLKAQAPHLDVSPALKLTLIPMIWLIEMFGLFVKHIVLAVRLFANMFAGHMVVGVFVSFIAVATGISVYGVPLSFGVTPVVIVSSVAINLLELMVAFIQAYVFAFLTSLFIGTAVHPH